MNDESKTAEAAAPTESFLKEVEDYIETLETDVEHDAESVATAIRDFAAHLFKSGTVKIGAGGPVVPHKDAGPGDPDPNPNQKADAGTGT